MIKEELTRTNFARQSSAPFQFFAFTGFAVEPRLSQHSSIGARRFGFIVKLPQVGARVASLHDSIYDADRCQSGFCGRSQPFAMPSVKHCAVKTRQRRQGRAAFADRPPALP